MATFEEMSRVDVSGKMEKKGKFAYLSWPFAVSEFRKNCPNGVWRTVLHGGSPVLTLEQGHFVEVEVVPDMATPEIRFSQLHPILDQNNKPIAAPNAFQVNTSIQRCLVKAIAIATGIGLFIYAGEDLPEQDEESKTQPITPAQATVIEELISATKADKAGFLSYFDVEKTSDLTGAQHKEAIALLNRKAKK